MRSSTIKTKRELFYLIVLCVFLNLKLNAQDSSFVINPALIGAVSPNFVYSLKTYNPLLIPYIPFSKGNFYGEVRYNYDRNGTLGLYGGRNFMVGKTGLNIFTPQIGILLGDYQGASFQFYYNLIHPKVEFNLTNQYSVILNDRPNFYFNWSDIQFPIFNKFRAGATVQIFWDNTIRMIDPGILIGYRTDKLYLMLSSFNPWDKEKHFIFFAVQYKIVL